MASRATTYLARRSPWFKLLAAGLLLVAALALLLALFPWDWLRGPLNRYVSERTGRHFEITRRLDVDLGRTTRVIADGIVFANPEWARDPYLVKAEGAEVHVRLWPLLRGRIELPRIELRRPELGLQMEPDGRRTWALDRQDKNEPRREPPHVGVLVVDEGSLHFLASGRGADIRADFAIDTRAAPRAGGSAVLPLTFKAQGTWQKAPFAAQGQTGNVLSLGGGQAQQPFPAQIVLTAGGTSLRAEGTVAGLPRLEGADVDFNLQGRNLAELYPLVGVVLPETPRYAVRGRLQKQAQVWSVSRVQGRLGQSDIAGHLSYDRSGAVPLLTGQLQSQALDLDDLAPLVGLPEQRKGRPVQAARRGEQGGRVLPDTPLDVERLKAMNADVRFSAARMVNVRQLPLDRMSGRVRLEGGLLRLDDLDLGVAGGRLAGQLRIDGRNRPADVAMDLDARGLELGRLVPGLRNMNRASVGRIHGDIELQGRGRTVAEMLGSSSGNVALLMGQGRISNLLLEFAGLDGAEVAKFLLGKDQSVPLRCAATAFDVKQGLMTARALVLDTADTVIWGSGTINLATEALDLTFKPRPKDPSILTLRSPLHLTGTLGNPQGSLDMGSLAGRAGLALALGAINPLLALAATIETGPGENADCSAVLREASSSNAASGRAAAATMGGPAAAGAAASTSR
ncbi:AsmA family protein [Ramlibacter tataouinensis]|uniref:AsmA domain-containing protein n=1 Tax=Ramlibacter tataouinensis (strain ATCC BAA-407 / DSM 14655 / LMG 21543 / TTB310) TaxID=365046 RepID=F5XWP8_RAMTT|nr:AsmA family protein [Ramlibacter tataouinensis]AEG94192.1 conserved hypothetical protein [Ramlibacter tataouinensis TTB310]